MIDNNAIQNILLFVVNYLLSVYGKPIVFNYYFNNYRECLNR